MNMEPIEWDGQQIAQEGVYSGIPTEAYHNNPYLLDAPSISSSGLRDFIKRPSLYWGNSVYNSKRYPQPERDHFTFGQAAHHLLLGEKNFNKFFAIQPLYYDDDGTYNEALKGRKAFNGNSIVCKDWIAEQKSQHKSILNQKQLQDIIYIKEKLENRYEIQSGILNGYVETSMFIKVGKFWLRSRPDVIPSASTDFCDLKMTAKGDMVGLKRAIGDFGYHIQAAVCRKVARKLYGDDIPFSYALIFCENKAPYDPWIHQVERASLDIGENQVDIALQYLEKCVDRWEFPSWDGFDPAITDIGITEYEAKRIDDQNKYIQLELDK